MRADLTARPPAFEYRAGRVVSRQRVLHCARVPLTRLAEQYGTPLYVYSAAAIRDRYKRFDAAFAAVPHTVCYSVKANSNLAILRLLDKLGCGFDVVSGGELGRVAALTRKALRKVVFSGVGKTAAELDAALKAGILLFNVESPGELRLLAERARKLRTSARVALRVNPDVNAVTHPYIATGLREHKFGVPLPRARELYAEAGEFEWLDVAGVSVHIGSQISSVDPFHHAMERLAELVRQLSSDGHYIRYIDAGGGLGIDYDARTTLPEFPELAQRYADAILRPLAGLNIHLLLEPGRAIVGPAGALLSRVLYLKENGTKRFVVVDAAMNDLLRPSLYGAYHEIVPVTPRDGEHATVDVVGPVCETGDFLARDRHMPPLQENDLVAVLDAGAYGMAQASNYNTRSRPAEVLVDGARVKLVRRRESLADLLRPER